MKELNEYKAEIFRRMEEGIKERKRCRRHALGWGISLCLCVTVASVTVLPRIIPVGSDKAEEMAGETPSNGEQVYAYAEVLEDGSIRLEDPDALDALYGILDGAFEANEDVLEPEEQTAVVEGVMGENDGTPPSDYVDDEAAEVVPDASEETAYIVVFTTSGGEGTMTYLITEDEIINQTTGERQSLTPIEREALLLNIDALFTKEETK